MPNIENFYKKIKMFFKYLLLNHKSYECFVKYYLIKGQNQEIRESKIIKDKNHAKRRVKKKQIINE
ncbi:hypothetical protein LV89_01127 [Arcicella aurantiaca]|uniref:Uncharacterized protein n=1 Tax=Arcicella aurantiaca TaxID=591202 RepID=A0A316EHR6_9BACT|nr:hypothetical protein [Arcicella aurantiaca]PWK28343.1 hypothetical protein LV89_01127 [Arcicella aurantiaca]